MKKEPPACEICGQLAWSLIHENLSDRLHNITGSFSYWQCNSCTVGRTWPVPTNLEEYYPNDYYAYENVIDKKPALDGLKARILLGSWRMRFFPEPFRTMGMRLSSGRRCVDEVGKYAPGPLFHLLDVGCGSGFFLRTLKRLGIHGYGVELSKAGADATTKSGFVCHHGPIETASFSKGSFDIVRFSHVLEHVKNPSLALNATYDLLKKGGKVVIRVPNAESIGATLFGRDWWALEIPRHLWHFTARSLLTLLMKCGFKVSTTETLSRGKILIDSIDYHLQSVGFDNETRELAMSHVPLELFDQVSRAYADIGLGELIEVIGVKI